MIRGWLRSRLDRHPLNPLVLALRLVRALGMRHLPFIALNLPRSRAQLLQDLWVLIRLGRKRGGYFVEIGAGDGKHLSNTWLLEKRYGWRGILAEPGRAFHDALRAGRAAGLDVRAVWSRSGETKTFVEVGQLHELSTLKEFQHADHYERQGTEYAVKTVSLNDLLHEHGAPPQIDYVSIDTEGAELEILEAFDFTRFRVEIFTLEHNFVAGRREAFERLLARHGYRRVLGRFTRFDAWFERDPRAA